MSVVVVTVTQTVTPSSVPGPPSISPGVIAGIVIGTLVGGILLIALVFYLLRRYARHRFTRVANPAAGTDLRHLPTTGSRRSKIFARHLRGPSVSSEPLMSSASSPPLPSISRVLSSGTPPRPDPVVPGIGDSPQSSFDLGEIKPAVPFRSDSYSTIPTQQTRPASLQPGPSNTPPQTRQMSGEDGVSTPTPPRSPPTLFVNRMLKSRAQASEDVYLAHRTSLDALPSRSTTLDSSNLLVDQERLIAEAERTALRDAERAQREKEEGMAKEEGGWGEAESTGSIYSQGSASIDHSFFSEPVSRLNGSLSVPRRGSSRKRRAHVPSTEPAPALVVEVPDTPEGQHMSSPVSTVANSSLDANLSHSQPISMVLDQPLPLLTSANFGRNSTMSGTLAGSISSNAGRGSSPCTSRYPSLAPSSIDKSSRSGPRSDVDTDWHHPPPGLAGLTSLQIGSLRNPHSPVDERPRVPADGAPLARLRESTASSVPEVEQRDFMQGGIASIDVVL